MNVLKEKRNGEDGPTAFCERYRRWYGLQPKTSNVFTRAAELLTTGKFLDRNVNKLRERSSRGGALFEPVIRQEHQSATAPARSAGQPAQTPYKNPLTE